MIPKRPGLTTRFPVAVAVASAGLAPSLGAHAQAPSAGISDAVVRAAAEPASAAAGVAPRISLFHTFTGDVHEEFRLDIRFTQSVTGFALSDIEVRNAVAVPPLEGSGSRYFVTMHTVADYEGPVIIEVPSNAARNSANEGNIGTAYAFEVDTRAPVIERAVVDRDELVITVSEDLDESAVPSVNDFLASYIRDGNYYTEDVILVEVLARDIFLTLDRPVRFGDQVSLFYDDRGARAARDPAGNLLPGVTDLSVNNRTGPQDDGVAPSPPRNLTADADGSSVIELNWDPPADTGSSAIAGYRIEASSDGTAPWSVVERDTRSAATSYRHAGIAPSTTNYYRVSAINGELAGDPSNVAGATTAGRVPDAPRRLTAVARGGSVIELDWLAPFSGAGGAIIGYRIEASSDGGRTWRIVSHNTNSTETEYAHTGLGPGTTKHYRVSAINAAGIGAASNVARATTEANVPGTPTGLAAVPSGLGGTSQLLLSWARPSSDGGSAITGYRIETSPNGATGWTVLAATTGSAATTYLHRGLAPGTTRFYRVAALNAVGAGDHSNVARGATNAGPPGQPRDLRARAAGPRSIAIFWQVPLNDNGAAITGYRIRARGPRDGGWVTIRQNTNSTETEFTHTGLQPVTAYRYQVAAINSVGAGAWSLEAGTSTHPDVPSAPVGLAARPVGTSQIDLSWQEPRNDNGAPIIGYRVEASSDGGRTWRVVRHNTESTETEYSHRGLQPASTRHYRVYGINVAGFGAASNVARATTEATVPGAPRDLTAKANGTSRIDLAWEEPATDGGAEIEGYRVEVSDDRGVTWNNLAPNTHSAATSYSHTGLAPASTRHYRVSAINRIGLGNASRAASATTDAAVPDAPTGLTATATAPTRIDLAWAAPAYDGGAAITGYRIEVSETGGNWTDLRRDTGSPSASFSHTGLLPGSLRFYRVSAINAAGTGRASGVASAATDDPIERAGRLNAAVLPHVAGAMASSTVGAIADRVDAVASGMGMERRMQMGGLSSMAASLSAPHAPGAGPGRHGRAGFSALLGGMSFQMPLGAADAPQQALGPGRMATWGAGEYHHMGEPRASVVEWSGGMASAHVGADTRVASDILAGIAASYSSGGFDFTDRTGAAPVAGTYGAAMTSVNPYVAWFPGGRGNAAWGTAGFGWGDVEIEDEREDLRISPARMMSGAGGGSYQLLESGVGGVRVKAEGWLGRVMVDGGERVDSVTLDMQRARLALEWTQGYRSPRGNEVAIVIEGGMRYDNGAGINGAGAEFGGGLRYANARVGLTAEGRGRLLASAREGYEEWGFGGMIQLDPGARGEGLQIRVAPSYGDAASGLRQLWDRGVSGAVGDRDRDAGANVDGEVAYGMPGFHGTPYGGFRLSQDGARAFSGGLRYDLGSGAGLRIEGTRREGALGAAEHTFGVRGQLRLR